MLANKNALQLTYNKKKREANEASSMCSVCYKFLIHDHKSSCSHAVLALCHSSSSSSFAPFLSHCERARQLQAWMGGGKKRREATNDERKRQWPCIQNLHHQIFITFRWWCSRDDETENSERVVNEQKTKTKKKAAELRAFIARASLHDDVVVFCTNDEEMGIFIDEKQAIDDVDWQIKFILMIWKRGGGWGEIYWHSYTLSLTVGGCFDLFYARHLAPTDFRRIVVVTISDDIEAMVRRRGEPTSNICFNNIFSSCFLVILSLSLSVSFMYPPSHSCVLNSAVVRELRDILLKLNDDEWVLITAENRERERVIEC